MFSNWFYISQSPIQISSKSHPILLQSATDDTETVVATDNADKLTLSILSAIALMSISAWNQNNKKYFFPFKKLFNLDYYKIKIKLLYNVEIWNAKSKFAFVRFRLWFRFPQGLPLVSSKALRSKRNPSKTRNFECNNSTKQKTINIDWF